MKKYIWAIVALVSIIFAGISINGFVVSLRNEGALPDSSQIFGAIWQQIAALIFIIVLLWVQHIFTKRKDPKKEFLSELKIPVSVFAKKKIPWWLLIYAFIIIGIIVYSDLFLGGF